MRDLIQEIKKNHLENELWQSLMGIEVETQRIDKTGHLSRQPYPNTLGSRQFHPNLQTDFGETQTEWITDPMPDDHLLITQLNALKDVFVREMPASDRLWLLSMPPALTHEDRLYVRNHFGRPKYQHYRDYLDGKFGIAHGLTTGVHLNFSLSDRLVESLAAIQKESRVDIANQLYWRVLQNFMKYRWLMTYFFGASPIAEKGYFQQMPEILQNQVRSIRNSSVGFNNGGKIDISYSTFEQHVKELQTAIDTGKLYAQMEFYGPVRIKGQANAHDYRTKGIKYLEFRVFDTNPFVPLGVDENEVNFIRAFLTYCLFRPVDSTKVDDELSSAAKLNNSVAMQSPSEPLENVSYATALMDVMTDTLKKLDVPTSLLNSIQFYKSQLDHPETTTAGRLGSQISHGSLTSAMLSLSNKRFLDIKTNRRQILPDIPFDPDVQALLAAGIKIGLTVDWSSINGTNVTFSNKEHRVQVSTIGPKVTTNITQLLDRFPELNLTE